MLTTTFYISAIISVFVSKKIKIWASLLTAGIVMGLYAGHLSWVALPFLGIILGMSYGYFHFKATFSKIIMGFGFILICTFTLLNHLPGVHNWQIIPTTIISAGGYPFTVLFGLIRPSLGCRSWPLVFQQFVVVLI